MRRFAEHWDTLSVFVVPHPITKQGPILADDGFQAGAFEFPALEGAGIIRVLVSNHEWEHVSASCIDRCPTWAEMCMIKDIFWDSDECVVQFHPPASEYINYAPHCLHLWRPLNAQMPMPPSWMVGPKQGQSLAEMRSIAEAAMGEVAS